jgi:nuclear transport factor 2 (NTF2) superfamily protein
MSISQWERREEYIYVCEVFIEGIESNIQKMNYALIREYWCYNDNRETVGRLHSKRPYFMQR